MEKRILGKTGISVSVLGYGAMALRELSETEAAALLNALLDSGVTYIDTSPDYGLSETYIGKAIAHRRDEFILASKCGCNHDDQGRHLDPQHIWTRARLLDNIERSLRLLKTDHLDVWQLHSPAPDALPGGAAHEAFQALLEVKQQGKVRAIGISFANGKKEDPLYPTGRSYQYVPIFLEYGFDVMQIVYSVLARKSETSIQLAAQKGVGTVVRGIRRKYFDNFPELFTRAHLNELCAPGESMDDFLLRYALGISALHTMIIGTHTVAHLADNLRAVEKGALPPEIFAEAQKRLDAAGITAGPA